MTTSRRTLLTSLAATASATVAGCLGGHGILPDARLLGNSGSGTLASGKTPLEKLYTVSADELSLLVTDVPSRATLELYLGYPTVDDPAGDWRLEGGSAGRPTLELPVADEPLEATVVEKKQGEENVVAPRDAGTKITFEIHEDLPTGAPIQFTLETGGDGRRLGTTQPVVIVPGENEAIAASRSPDGYEPFRYSSEEAVFFDRETTDEGYRIRMAAGTNDTRYHTPSHDAIPNRNDEVGFDQYERGAFERPWGIEYEITETEYDAALRHWTQHYRHKKGDEGQLRPAWRHYLDGGKAWGIPHETVEPIERLAETFATKAKRLGLDRPEEMVRFVADVIQWMEYETDEQRKLNGLPEVQHPVTFFARGRGDCIDKVIAATSLLYQDPFPDFVMDKYYIFRNPYTGGLFQGRTQHIGLTIESDIFTTDLGGPQVDDDDGYTYVEVTYPAPLSRTDSRNRELELVDISDAWPGY